MNTLSHPAAALVAALLSITCAAPGSTATVAPPHSGPVTLPVHTGSGHLLHEVWLEDQGPFWAILDTGNQGTMVFQRVVDRLGLETEPLGQLGGAGSGLLDVSGTRDLRVTLRGEDGQLELVESLATVIPDAASLPDFDGRRVDVFLGASLIGERLVTIDYPAGRLTFRDRTGQAPPEGAHVLDLQLTAGFPHLGGEVAARIGGEPGPSVAGRFLLDLGSPMGLQLDHEPTRAAGLLDGRALADAERRVEGQLRGIDGTRIDLVTVPVAALSLGSQELTGAPGYERMAIMTVPGGGPPIDDLVGSLGSGPFRSGRLTLDYAGGRAWLEPSASGPSSSVR